MEAERQAVVAHVWVVVAKAADCWTDVMGMWLESWDVDGGAGCSCWPGDWMDDDSVYKDRKCSWEGRLGQAVGKEEKLCGFDCQET